MGWRETKLDKTHEKGQYILTGSTSVDESNIIHTGTGRIHRMIMYPMSLYESGESNGKIQLTELFNNPNIDIEGITSDLSLENLFFVMCRGGWPESLQIKNKDNQLLIAKSYFDSICENDVSTVDDVKNSWKSKKFWNKFAMLRIKSIHIGIKIIL